MLPALSPLDTASAEPPPVGRLAPSPTGSLHLGHARSFLLAWWHARSRGGRIVMRMEDLDGPRSEPRFVDQALEDLEWLGIDWDGPVVLQSTGLPRFVEALERLLQADMAYPCVCSRGDIRAAQNAPQQGALELRYPGTCRGRFANVEEALRTTGLDAGVRFRVGPGAVVVNDRFARKHAFDVAGSVGDFLIGRRDGAPAYQLAVVLDDAEQGVTEIVRGDDLLPSAARQILLQRALGLPAVAYYHVPLVVDESGRRLAKRHDDLSLSELRQRGVDPRALVGWVATSAGMLAGERLSAREYLPSFSMTRVPAGSVTAPQRF